MRNERSLTRIAAARKNNVVWLWIRLAGPLDEMFSGYPASIRKITSLAETVGEFIGFRKFS
jgi:hypothetical protein